MGKSKIDYVEAFAGLISKIIILLLAAFIIQISWNYVVPKLFDIQRVTFSESICIRILYQSITAKAITNEAK